MTDLSNIPAVTELDLLVAFSDLTNFARSARGQTHEKVFTLMSDYAEMVGDVVEAGGGRVVKFIGDAVLMAFPPESVDAGVVALKKLKDQGDEWLESRGMSCRHQIKAHFGPVTCGPFGTRTDKRFDLYGDTVMIAAVLKATGLAITPQAFRKLKPETRKLFKKHTPPVTYIPVEAPHRD